MTRRAPLVETTLDDVEIDEARYGPDATVLTLEANRSRCGCGAPLGSRRVADGYDECQMCEERRLRELDQQGRDYGADVGIPKEGR